MKNALNFLLPKAKRALFFILIITITIIMGCARMSAPNGGPKDVDAPVALKSRPVNYSVNFNDSKIIVEFDEFISLRSVRQELLVSPPLPEKPEIKLRGKNMIIKINNDLKDSTTYNFNFYNAIVDLNEGIPLKNFQFEVSTGPVFDSIYLGGFAHDAFNYLSEAGWYVMLYDKFNDTIPRTTLPNYVAKTDDKGKYFITNLKKKPYYIFALKDMNNNMLFDLPNETIAFLDTAFSPEFIEKTFVDTIQVIKSISDNLKDTIVEDSLIIHKNMVTTVGNIRLYMFVEDFEQQYFKQYYRNEKQQVIFSFNNELKDSISVIPLIDSIAPTNWFIQEKFEKNDSLVYWITDSLLYNNDSLKFQLNYTMKDSTHNNYTRTDTLLVIYKAPKKKEDKKSGKKKGGGMLNLGIFNDNKAEAEVDSIIPPSELTFEHNAKTPFELNKSIEFTARFPLKNIDNSRIVFSKIEDDTVKIPVKVEMVQSKNELRKYYIDFEKDEEESFELFIPAGAITDIYNNINDTLIYKFKTRAFDYYSTIAMEIVGVKQNSIVQLLSEKEQVLDEQNITTDTIIYFDYLKPAKYKFKLYYDINNNGKWDTGNFKKLQQPEQVFYYPFFPKSLETKSNMDIENTWELYPVQKDTINVPQIKINTTEH